MPALECGKKRNPKQLNLRNFKKEKEMKLKSTVEVPDFGSPEKMQKWISEMDSTHLFIQMQISLGTANALSHLFSHGCTADFEDYLVTAITFQAELYRAEGVRRGLEGFDLGGPPLVVN